MLQAFIKNSWIPITSRKKYYIEYQYGGQQTLSFSLPASDDLNKELQEEMQVKEECENCFLIKKISRVGNYVDYICELDMDEFKLSVYKSTKDLDKFQTKSLLQIVTAVLPNGWSVLNANIRDIKRTVELEGATDYDVLFKCEEIFDIVFEINNIAKSIRVIDPEQFEYTGIYIHRDLNLRSYTMKGDSSNMITRLYCEGKDGLTFAAINDGKDYVENLRYKNKVLSAFWKDERYTVAENLLADGKKKLDSLAVPNRSYIFNVVDLANLNKTYDFLTFHIYQSVKVIIDENLSIMNRVIKYRKYIDDNEKSQNIITLSNEPQTLKSVISNALGGDIKDTIKGSFLEQAQKESAAIINEFATKGHRYETDSETYFLDKLPKETAKCVMRMNLGGIAFSTNGWSGPYTTAWTIDGKFNADFISTGTLQAIRINAAEIVGGSINIGDGSFMVDSSGHLTMKKGSIHLGSKFSVDESGNLKCSDANITGTVNATSGTFTGLIKGADVEGGSISGATLISETPNKKVEIYDGLIKFTDKRNGYTSKLYPEISIYMDYADTSYCDDRVVSKCNIETDATITTKEQINVGGNIYGKQDAHISNNCFAKGYKTVSDRRKKKDIEDTDISELIDITAIKKFRYINDQKQSVGVIAQDYVDTPFEEIVLSKDDNGYYTVDYNAFLMALIQKVKDQQEKIDYLFKLLEVKEVTK